MPDHSIKVENNQNVHSILDKMLQTARLAGLLPIKKTSNTSYKTSRLWMFFSFMTITAFLIASYPPIRKILTAVEGSTITNLGNKITIMSSIGVCVAFYVLTICNRNKLAQFLQTILLVTSILENIGVVFSYNRIILAYRGQMAIGVCLCVIVSTITSSSDSWNSFVAQLTANLVTYALACLFVSGAYLIHQRFSIVNKRISEIKFEGYVNSAVGDIRTLARCHGMLCDACELINDAYDFQLLIYVTVVFVTGLFSTFNDVQALYRPTPLSHSDIMEIVRSTAWNCYNELMLVLILVACAVSSSQVDIFMVRIKCSCSRFSVRRDCLQSLERKVKQRTCEIDRALIEK